MAAYVDDLNTRRALSRWRMGSWKSYTFTEDFNGNKRFWKEQLDKILDS